MSIRVITYNLHKGIYRTWSPYGLPKTIMSVPSISEQLKILSPDLLFLQEVQGKHTHHETRYAHWLREPQHEFLAQALALQPVYASNAHYLHGHHGNALLSKYSIAQYVNHNISDHVLEQRGILHCQLELFGRTAHCYVVHLGLFAASRQRQITALIRIIQETTNPEDILLIAGDFNDWQEKLSIPLCQTLNLQEIGMSTSSKKTNVKHFKTYPSFFPCLSLDRIYYRGLKLIKAKVLTDTVWGKLSDHRPLFAEFEL